MITDDQVAELFAQANPVPRPDASGAHESVEVETTDATYERNRGMTTVKTREQPTGQRKGPRMAAALAVALAAVIAVPLFLTGGEQPEVAAPATPEDIAVQTVEELFAALTRGDVDAAMALMETEVQETPRNRHGVEFFAALPGTKTVSDCTTLGGPDLITVECMTNYNGPLMQAAGEQSFGIFIVRDGLLTTMFTPGSRDKAADAFFAYASQTEPEAYDQACNPDAYEAGSVRIQSFGFAFAGPCGELWAQVADDAAAWVGAGKPPLAEGG